MWIVLAMDWVILIPLSRLGSLGMAKVATRKQETPLTLSGKRWRRKRALLWMTSEIYSWYARGHVCG